MSLPFDFVVRGIAMSRIHLVARSESGQLLPLLAVFAVLIGLAIVFVFQLGLAVVLDARAQAAADAAALAGVGHDREAAESMARRNGATLVQFVRDGFEVE